MDETEPRRKIRVKTKVRMRKRVVQESESSEEEGRSPSPRQCPSPHQSPPPSRTSRSDEPNKVIQQHSIAPQAPQIGVKSLQEARLAYLSRKHPSDMTAKDNIELSRLRMLYAHCEPDPDAKLPFKIITTSRTPAARQAPANTTDTDNYFTQNVQKQMQNGYVNVRKTSGETPVTGVVFNVLYPNQLAGTYVPAKDGEKTDLAITTDYDVANDGTQHEILPEYKSEVKPDSPQMPRTSEQDQADFDHEYAAMEKVLDKSLAAPHTVKKSTEIIVNNATREYSMKEVVIEESGTPEASETATKVWSELVRVDDNQSRLSSGVDRLRVASEEKPPSSNTETVITKRIDTDTEEIIDDLISDLQKSKRTIASEHTSLVDFLKRSSERKAEEDYPQKNGRVSGSDKGSRHSGSSKKSNASTTSAIPLPVRRSSPGSQPQVVTRPGLLPQTASPFRPPAPVKPAQEEEEDEYENDYDDEEDY